MTHVGRFAPSPTGPLHAGSMVAALASWLDARAQRGRWLVRIEDVDTPRCMPGSAELILSQLAACGLVADDTPMWQSRRGAAYAAALTQLTRAGWAFPCGCTRQRIEAAWRERGVTRPRHGELVYPGTCRDGLQEPHRLPGARAVRMLAAASRDAAHPPLLIDWHDRRLGAQRQDVSATVGDFVLSRADGLWAYQLAVVVDDAAQGVTHVVRGEDLADNTPRQIHLQRALGLPTPNYLHTPLVLGADGQKLSKQNGAMALDVSDPLAALNAAGTVLDIRSSAGETGAWLEEAVSQWRRRWLA